MFGDIARQLRSVTENAFASQSSFKTVATFGMDNTVPFLMSILGITAHLEDFKPFDYYIANHFYYLNGEKFSTSRAHAIWVSDCQNLSAIEIDILRLYLMSIDVNTGVGHFVSPIYRIFLDETQLWLNEYVLMPAQQLQITNCSSESLSADRLEKVKALFAQQELSLHPRNFAPCLFMKGLDFWLQHAKSINKNSADYWWWIKALTIYIYPIMPKIAENLWLTLGYRNSPLKNQFSALPEKPGYIEKQVMNHFVNHFTNVGQ